MPGRITYRHIETLRDKNVFVAHVVLSEQVRTGIEELIKRPLMDEEITIVLKTIFRLQVLKRAELSIRKSKRYVTSQDIQRTLRSFAKLTPDEAFSAYQNSGKIIRSLIQQVLRMKLSVNFDGESKKLMSSLGLNVHTSPPQELTNALGNSTKKAASIALEYYPYTPLNPRPDHLKRNGKPAIGLPIRRNGQPVKRYREKLAEYALDLWRQLGMEPCKAWQHEDYDPNASEIVRFMLMLCVAIDDYPLLNDLKEAVRLLNEAEEWVVSEHPNMR